jgi:hypothetical protein
MVDRSHPPKRRRVAMPSDADGFTDPHTLVGYAPKRPFPMFSSAFGDGENNKKKIPDLRVISGPSSLVSRNMSMGKAAGGMQSREHVSVQDIHKTILAETSTKDKATKQLRPAPPPPPPPLIQVLPSTTSLKQVLPPAFPVEPRKYQKIHRQLQPPSFHAPRKAEDKILRTITTTTVLDKLNIIPSKGLTAAPLHERYQEFSVDESDPEPRIFRGLEVSPEKRGKGKNSKHKK